MVVSSWGGNHQTAATSSASTATSSWASRWWWFVAGRSTRGLMRAVLGEALHVGQRWRGDHSLRVGRVESMRWGRWQHGRQKGRWRRCCCLVVVVEVVVVRGWTKGGEVGVAGGGGGDGAQMGVQVVMRVKFSCYASSSAQLRVQVTGNQLLIGHVVLWAVYKAAVDFTCFLVWGKRELVCLMRFSKQKAGKPLYLVPLGR